MQTLDAWLADHYDPAHIAWHFLQGSPWTISTRFDVYGAIAETLASISAYAPQPNMTEGFWLKRKISGQLACVIAARRYVIRHSIAEEIPRMMPGATCSAKSAPSLSGMISFSGGLWCHPDHRGGGIATEATKTLHACALLLWNPDYMVGVAEKRLVGLSRQQGFSRIEPTVSWERWEMNLVWMDRREALLSLRDPASR